MRDRPGGSDGPDGPDKPDEPGSGDRPQQPDQLDEPPRPGSWDAVTAAGGAETLGGDRDWKAVLRAEGYDVDTFDFDAYGDDLGPDLSEDQQPAYDLEGRLGSQEAPDSPRQCLARFDPERAHLPPMDTARAATHIADAKDARPWLEPADGRGPDTQRVIAAAEQGRGHAVERHEGGADEVTLVERVRELMDPAQTDDALREQARDAFKNGRHVCADTATAITDPDAFATALANGTEHPHV